MKKTDIFIVGAPKCGTTSLHKLLSETEGVFAPKYKEPHHFGKDLVATNYIKSEKLYLELYQDADVTDMLIDASPLYYTSQNALREIKNYNKDAKVIFCIRNPYSAINSMYNGIYANGKESAKDIEESLARSDLRSKGKKYTGDVNPKVIYDYRFLFDFQERLKELTSIFDRKKVFLFNLEKYKENPHEAMQELSAFVGKELQTNLPKANEAKATKSRLLQRVIILTPYPIRKILSSLPKGIKRGIVNFNTIENTSKQYVDDEIIKKYINLDDQDKILKEFGTMDKSDL